MMRNRRGSALLWFIVIVSVVAAIAATAAPYLVTSADADRIATTATQLKAIRTGITSFELVVHRTNQAATLSFPGKISQLTTAVGASDHNSCGTGSGNTFNVANSQADWIANGPFVKFMVPVGGFWTPIGVVSDSIPVRTAAAAMYVEISGVTSNDAALIDMAIDAGSGDTVSTVHAAVNDTTTVRFRILSTAQATSINKC